MDDKIVITGMGMMTPVGHDSIMAPAAIRAGISRLTEIADFVTDKGDRTAGGCVSGITDGRSGSDRLLSMAIPALQEALYTAEEFYEDLDLSDTELFLCLSPPERPIYEDFDREDILTLLDSARAERVRSVEIIRDGHAGGIMALSKAIASLKANRAKHGIVGGVDSLVEYPSMAWLEACERLKTDERPHGFAPGEAAAFMVLELSATARRRGAPILGEIADLAYTREEATVFSDKPLFAKGLAESINAVLQKQRRRASEIKGIICDLNGEYYRMKEWGLAQSRIFDGSWPVPELWHPAESIGDIGSASAVVFTGVGVAAISRQYFPGADLLVWTASDTGGRGSVLLKECSQ